MAKTMRLHAPDSRAAFEAAGTPALSGMGTRAQGALMRLIRRWQAVRRHRAAMQELLQLDDRMLKDIGVDRSNIPRAALYGRDPV